ncbi:hypothetical protein BJY52DRAFT_1195284 [Lactarius psammicola]|nr:hypothetical protein BJY52DRAFT_1195284 [Lactarius psammicola]
MSATLTGFTPHSLTPLVSLPSTTLNPHICKCHDNGHDLTADLIEDMTLAPGAQTVHGRETCLTALIDSLIQYEAKVLVPILQANAPPTSRRRAQSADQLHRPEARETCGHHKPYQQKGVLPAIQQLISLERAPPPTPRLLTIERTQWWSMTISFPLQQLSFLRTNALPLPSPSGKPRHVTIDDGALRENRAYLVKRQRALDKPSIREKLRPQEHAELARWWDAWYNELAVNLNYLPMTIHWVFSEMTLAWDSLFGFAAAIASFRSGWKTTALAPPLPPAEPSEDALAVSKMPQPTNDTDSSHQ